MGNGTYDSKIGKIRIFEHDGFLTKIDLNPQNYISDNITPIIQLTMKQIDEYLTGIRKTFEIPYKLVGTDFSKRVLTVMSKIPYGEKCSYSKLSLEAGFEGAARAVGTVCKKNNLPIIIPCHRVIKSDGTFGQYQGGLDIKKALLELESIQQ
ncbi:MAG: methylated-DNA--[protein]-cysteine S-methyltransferase [Tenericutes bacterium]|nr:methylated-DNA--[protein]-cysteine S-methyltransferase [Mycoplasmatota bacterium]